MRTLATSSGTKPLKRELRWALASACAAVAIGFGAVEAPQFAVAVVAATTLIVLSMRHQQVPAVLLVLAAFTATPQFVPTSVAIGPFAAEFYEVLVLVCLCTYWKETPRKVQSATLLLLVLIAVFTVFGWANQADLPGLVQDTRRLAILILAVPIGWALSAPKYRPALVATVSASLWISAAVSVMASIGVLVLAGRTQSADFALDSENAATRLLSPATYLAVGVVCVGLGFLVMHGRKAVGRWVVIAIAPALVVFTLGFARNAVVTLLIALLVVGLGSSRVSRSARFARVVGAVAGAALALIFMRFALAGTGAGVWLQTQWDAFSNRVLFGLTPGGLSQDASANYRFEQENPYLLSAIESSPVYGHGFGYAYRPLSTGRYVAEGTEGLQLYAHNFYLWIWVKAGVVGLLAFVVPLVVLIMRGSRRSSIAPAAGLLAGLMVASTVAPMPVGSPTALLLGLLVGGLWRLVTYDELNSRAGRPRAGTSGSDRGLVSRCPVR